MYIVHLHVHCIYVLYFNRFDICNCACIHVFDICNCVHLYCIHVFYLNRFDSEESPEHSLYLDCFSAVATGIGVCVFLIN